MRSTTLLSITALASTALAQPFAFGHNHHARHHHARRAAAAVGKRDIVTDWTTEWVTETVTEYIDMTSTVVINTATTPGQFFEGSSTPPAAPASQPTPSKAAAPPSSPPATTPQASSPPSPPVQPQTPSPSPTSAAPKVQQAPEVSSAAPKAQQTQESATQVQKAPKTSSASTNTNISSTSASDSSSSGAMSFTGQVTHYTVGLGACGFDDAGKDNSDYIVAISSALMHGSNGDPMCNKKVNLSFDGHSITATIRDKCPSCSQDQIDLSEKAFKDLVGDLGIGRQGGVKWTIS
ncbi:hypothetical protein MCOR25_003959 [Pyricularia grisea]|uniref:RlpA-like protein double-psi beta-barrel domain-containing protein n=1 Tax=Pyricularia grisea TaxID=148305 RepID=A0A6P8BE03_PYRGI|nr:uncharacterized protein PgNI_04283 [Pyricularia grisea]KAI6371351.1 hypothetical protein MCOR25_003959 [Pyricularia grisea]TLD14048.1 hypothetical protein PgNI_04283 [Pyricularia grisea]